MCSETIIRIASNATNLYSPTHVTNATRPSESTLKICRTRINIGTKLVSCAANVASRWWTNSLDQKWKKSIAEIATTHNLLLDATAVEIYSAQERKRWSTRLDSGTRNVSAA
jgi:hypothetical protein